MDVADLVARFSAEGDERVIRALGQVDAGVNRVADSSTRAGRGLGTVFQVAGGFLAAQAVQGLFRLGAGLVNAQAEAEQAKVSLEVVTGSAEEAARVFENLQEFAAKTPFSVQDLLQATVLLESFGMDSERWLTTIGDTAAATGKSVDQVTQAVLDATTGEYERLKELGIQARVEGDKLTFSYMKNGEQITATVDKNNKEVIASTLEGIWNDKYEGAMEKQSRTFAGQMSTLKDNINLAMQSATAGVFSFATRGLAFINDIFADGFVATIRDRFGPGAAEFVGHVATMAGVIIDAFGEGAPVSELVKRLPESWQPVAEAVAKVADAFGDLWSDLSSGDFAGFFRNLGSEARQAGSALVQLAAAIGAKLLPEVQKLLDRNKWTAIIRIDSLEPAFSAAARGEWDQAFQNLLAADPIVVTPELEIDIERAISNWIANFGQGEGGGGGGRSGADLGRAIEIALQNIRIGPISFDWVADKLGPDFLRLGDAITAGVITGIERKFHAVEWATQFETIATLAANGFFNAFNTAIQNVPETFANIGTAITEVFFDMVGGIDWSYVAGKIGGDLWDAIAAALISRAPTTFGLREKIAEILGYEIGPSGAPIDPSKVGQFADIDLGALTGAANNLASIDLGPQIADFETLATKSTDLGTTVGTAATQVQAATKTMAAGIQDMSARGQTAIGAFRAAAQSQFAAVVGAAQQMASGVVGAVSALPGVLGSIGSAAGFALANGIASAIPAVQAAANAIAAAVDVAVRARLQIASPSRVMMRLGEATAEGFLLPLRSMEREAAGLLGAPGVPGLSPARVAAASGAGGGAVVYDLRGAFIGRGAEAEIRSIIAQQGATVIDRRLGAAQLAGARR